MELQLFKTLNSPIHINSDMRHFSFSLITLHKHFQISFTPYIFLRYIKKRAVMKVSNFYYYLMAKRCNFSRKMIRVFLNRQVEHVCDGRLCQSIFSFWSISRVKIWSAYPTFRNNHTSGNTWGKFSVTIITPQWSILMETQAWIAGRS